MYYFPIDILAMHCPEKTALRKEEGMKKLCFLIVALCVSAFLTSAAMSAGYQHVITQEGIEVTVQNNPLGPNNQIVAYVKFINNNGYKVNVNWKPIITCEGGDIRTGTSASFGMSEGGSYEVNIWRSQACGLKQMIKLDVEMDVK